MNIYGIIILITLLFSYILNLITNLMNLRNLKPDLPGEFEGIYDAETYRKSQEYTRVSTRFGFITSTFGILLTVVFWFLGGFNFLDKIIDLLIKKPGDVFEDLK